MGADGFTFLSDDDRLERAANGLANRYPALSYRGGLTKLQKRAVIVGIISLNALASVAADIVFWAGFSLFAVLILWRGVLVSIARAAPKQTAAAVLADADLPPYSVLVALYDEALSLPGLLKALCAIDYPETKLDIHLLLEECDHATRAALSIVSLPAHFHVHILGDGEPRTKPRALNYGLEFACGQYITIYDAEDRPHPLQIRRAAETFTTAPSQLACLQAPLIAHNRHESWVAAQWALEYDIQFGLLVPALSQAGFPIPLGGTSNHFKRAALIASGGWDAWNVTEDADLGLRFARMGYSVGTIDLPTYEEAPERLRVWAAQRSRWIKGFLQSWFVLMRAPLSSARDMGLLNWCSMQLTLGGAIISAICAGPTALWLILCLALPGLSFGAAGIGLLLFGYGVNVIAALAAPGTWSLQRVVTVATLPLYWPLLSLGAGRALYGLVRTPHFWAKTPHGLTAARMDEGPEHCSPSIGYSHSAL